MPSGVIFDIKHFAIHDGPGIRTTLFMKGCPLRCAWCHNPESQEENRQTWKRTQYLDGKCYQDNEWVGKKVTTDEVMNEIKKDIPFHRESGGGVTFSGGEPLMQPDFLEELLRKCREEGIHTCIDTSGHAPPAVVRRVMELTDLFLYDLKIMDDLKHLEYTGISNELVISNLKMLAREEADIIVRFPLIPGITDHKSNLAGIITLMESTGLDRIELLPYHAIAEHKYRKMGATYRMAEVREPEKADLERAGSFFNTAGMHTVIEK